MQTHSQTQWISSWFPRQRFPIWAVCVLVAGATVVLGEVPARAAQRGSRQTDKREIDARQAFAAGSYQEALDLYAELYADKVHPTYLRNIGRCYQNLQQPDKAINAFRDYLRQAKGLSAVEKNEVDGYIAEMELLKKQQVEAAARPPVPQPLPPPPQNETVGQPTGANLQTSEPTPALPPPTPFYKKGWFWGVAGVAVAAGVLGGLYAGGVFSASSRPCTVPGGCY